MFRQIVLSIRSSVANPFVENPFTANSFTATNLTKLCLTFSVSLFFLIIPTTLYSQDFDDPFADPFTESEDQNDSPDPFDDVFDSNEGTSEEPNPEKIRGSISIGPGMRINITGPGGVPDLNIIPTLRIGLNHSPEEMERPSLTTRESEIRFQGKILERDAFFGRFNLAGDRDHGVLSEVWFDTSLAHGFHLTAGRIPNTMGLESFPGHERRISITPGLLDWAGGGSAWGIRTGGRWINGTLTGDLQFLLDEPVDVDGNDFGGYGVLTKITMRPLSQFLFGGPSAPDRLWKDTSLFVTGRWDWEADGAFRIRSASDLNLLATPDLHFDNIHWVRAGWRLPLSEYLQFENEWLRTGFFGVGSTDIDMPGEMTGFQMGLRVRLSSNVPLPFDLPLDLPGGDWSFDDPSSALLQSSQPEEVEDQGLDLILRYEQLTSKSQLADFGLLEVGSPENDLESIRIAVTRSSSSSIRWTLEGVWTGSDTPILLKNSTSADNLFTFRCLFELGL
ncbi:MAG: hypothetical protein CBC13_03385 [Planctomycetia bacterium TMED53]|nr:MAG: hypothetical protein CBC13_03385 [Planctomycetia bacterium TMED53]